MVCHYPGNSDMDSPSRCHIAKSSPHFPAWEQILLLYKPSRRKASRRDAVRTSEELCLFCNIEHAHCVCGVTGMLAKRGLLAPKLKHRLGKAVFALRKLLGGAASMKAWMKGMLLAGMALLFLNFGHLRQAEALSCVPPRPIDEALGQYDGVIVGKVESVEQGSGDYNEVTLRVLSSYKAITEHTLVVRENVTWGSLWGNSQVEEEYLFFLQEQDGIWENPLCAPTRKLADAKEELEYLRGKELALKPVVLPAGSSSEDGVIEGGSAASVQEEEDHAPLKRKLALSGAGLLGLAALGTAAYKIRRRKP